MTLSWLLYILSFPITSLLNWEKFHEFQPPNISDWFGLRLQFQKYLNFCRTFASVSTWSLEPVNDITLVHWLMIYRGRDEENKKGKKHWCSLFCRPSNPPDFARLMEEYINLCTGDLICIPMTPFVVMLECGKWGQLTSPNSLKSSYISIVLKIFFLSHFMYLIWLMGVDLGYL